MNFTLKTPITFIHCFFIVILLSGFASCVPARKYEELLDKNKSLEQDLQQCQEERKIIHQSDSLSKSIISELYSRIKKAELDSIEIHTMHNKTKELYQALNDTYERLLKHNQSENSRYNENLRDAESRKLASMKELEAREAELNRVRDELSKMRADLLIREEKVNELQRRLQARDSAAAALKNLLNQALVGYQDAGLEINIRNGKVYVSLSDRLLFAPGSIVVDKKGQEALIKLSGILKQQNDLNIMIEGHTDDQPISTDKIKDNWDLSVLRATSIVRILTNEGKLEPQRIYAAGRGEFDPMASNKIADGRKKNRRTEIILYPKLDQLYQLIRE